MARPDQDQVLRRLPIVVGSIGGTLLFLNRVMTPELSGSQSRSDALGVIISAILILTGLLWQRIQPKRPESVELLGDEGFELSDDLPDAVKTELAWASHLLLTNTATRTVLVYYDQQVILRRGVLVQQADAQAGELEGTQRNLTPGTILKRVISKQKPIYLVNLALYPGRVEFDYLPENTQGLIAQPLGKNGALILGANAPRSYTQQDEAWITGIAEKLTNTLQSF